MRKGGPVSADIAKARRAAIEWWRHPTRGSTAALFRIAFGLMSIWTAIGVGLNLDRYYADDGMIPWHVVGRGKYAGYSLFSIASDSEALLRGHFVLFLIASILLTVGFYARPAAVLIFIINLSLAHRNNLIVNSGDRLFLMSAVYAACMPLSQRWSLEALWRKRPGPATQSGWGLRLVQLQIAYIYLSAAFSKLGQPRWLNGHAMRDVLSSPLYAEWPTYVDFWPLIYALTWGTLVFELVFPLGIWFKRYRPWLIAAGIGFHVGIDITMCIPMFSWMMMLSYLAYLTDDESEALVRFVRARTGWLALRPSR